MPVGVAPEREKKAFARLMRVTITDWICNWMGNFGVANSINWSGKTTFASKAVTPYTVSGTSYGEFKSVSNLSWLRVYAAGHEV